MPTAGSIPAPLPARWPSAGLTRVLVEGGGELAASFLRAAAWSTASPGSTRRGSSAATAGPPPERSAITRLADAPAFALARLARHRRRRPGRLYLSSTEDIMFTGIITDLGRVRCDPQPTATPGSRSRPPTTTPAVPIGASIACSGVCLTVVDKARGLVRRHGLGRDAVAHDARRLAGRHPGQPRTGAEARRRAGRPPRLRPCRRRRPSRLDRRRTATSQRFVFERPRQLARFIAPKGSIAVDGISLTVNEVDGARFGVNIIPHTLAVTTFGAAQARRSGQPGNRHAGALCRPPSCEHG